MSRDDEDGVEAPELWLPPCPGTGRPQNYDGRRALDEDVVRVLCQDIADGVTLRVAFSSAGWQSPPLENWRALAEESPDPFWEWAVFCVDTAQAQAEAEVMRLHRQIMRRGGNEDAVRLKAAQAWLERRSPEFRPSKDVQHSGTQPGQVNTTTVTQTILVREEGLQRGLISVAQALHQTSPYTAPRESLVDTALPSGELIDHRAAPPKYTLTRRPPSGDEDED